MVSMGKYFTLNELTKSVIAARNGIDNIPSSEEIESLKILVKYVLDPIRENFNKPVMINSGFRNKQVNKIAKGQDKSQHVLGEAADIEILGVSNYDLACWIKNNLIFDQLILEFATRGDPTSGWVHVSYTNRKPNKKECLTIFTKEGYLNGIIKP